MTTQHLQTGWRLQSAAVAGGDGADLSRAGADVGGWHDTLVPSTVLCALVRDGTYPDPRFWPNPFRIPDSSDEFNAAHDLAQFSHLPENRNPWRDPWWYRTEFDLDGLADGRRVWLTVNCLNYRADVWVNGTRVADREQLVGMFQRFRLDITEAVAAGRNAVAILVYPVDHPGTPDTQLQVYGPVRSFFKDLCNDVTEVMSIGYDCFPTVPDRNLGLIQEVALDITGPVDLRHPFVRCDLPLPELNPARLTVSAELVNTSARTVRGVLEGTISGPDGKAAGSFSRPTTLLSHETRLITVGPTDAPELAIADPQLWWPNTYGEQPLYALQLRFTMEGQDSACATTPFGIRRIHRELYELDGAHGFRLYVNGQRIFQRGGYIQPEMMFDWDPQRVEAELRYLAHANLNYVVFEDIPNPPDWYLDLCDRYGLLFWNCFYDCYWLQYDRPWDIDVQVLEDCTVDLVKRYRNHPSLIIYMAQNEGETREDVYAMWRRTVLSLDDTRFLVPSGSFPDYRTEVPEWFGRELPVGMNDYMPKTYGWQMPWVYYHFVREARNWMFMIESCSASLPPLESLERFIPQLRDRRPNPGGDPVYPLDEAWAHFGANSYYEWFDRGLRLLYGEPRDVGDYVWKAHLVTYDQHRALFEAVHHRLWDITSGFGEWKLNSAFPDVQWQLYDWFLRPMVSLYAIRKACAPLAVQLCPLDGMVSVVNNGLAPVSGLRARATVLDLSLRVLEERSEPLDAAASSYHDLFAVTRPASVAEAPVYFVKLELRDDGGEVVADNFYWLSPRLDDYEELYQGDLRQAPCDSPLAVPRQTPCFPELADLPAAELTVEASRSGAGGVTVRLTNPGAGLAFFIRVRVLQEGDGEEVLPVYWSDNYCSLLPGESKQLTAGLPAGVTGGLRVAVDGWNIVGGSWVVG
jgi:hypothetical protein